MHEWTRVCNVYHGFFNTKTIKITRAYWSKFMADVSIEHDNNVALLIMQRKSIIGKLEISEVLCHPCGISMPQ